MGPKKPPTNPMPPTMPAHFRVSTTAPLDEFDETFHIKTATATTATREITGTTHPQPFSGRASLMKTPKIFFTK